MLASTSGWLKGLMPRIDPATAGKIADEEIADLRLKHSADHKRIVAISTAFGLAGAATGVVLVIYAAGLKEGGRDFAKILMAPLVFAVEGLVWGVSVALLFAPQDFLTGPFGRKWMGLVGTTDVVVARIICFIIAFLISAFLPGLR